MNIQLVHGKKTMTTLYPHHFISNLDKSK